MTELWKDVDGYEGLYQVSNTGRVRSLSYRRHGFVKELVPKINNYGRLWFDLWKNGENTPMLAHRIVANAFIPNPNGYPQINHIDENPKNNNVENLEWCTAEENRAKYLANHKGERRPVKKYSNKYRRQDDREINQISMEGEVVRVWENVQAVLHEKGWSAWSISECCRGKRKTAYGYFWRYANNNISGREIAQQNSQTKNA